MCLCVGGLVSVFVREWTSECVSVYLLAIRISFGVAGTGFLSRLFE